MQKPKATSLCGQMPNYAWGWYSGNHNTFISMITPCFLHILPAFWVMADSEVGNSASSPFQPCSPLPPLPHTPRKPRHPSGWSGGCQPETAPLALYFNTQATSYMHSWNNSSWTVRKQWRDFVHCQGKKEVLKAQIECLNSNLNLIPSHSQSDQTSPLHSPPEILSLKLVETCGNRSNDLRK